MPKMAWNKLKEDFEGNERVKALKLLTFKREFELLKMIKDEDIKSYALRVIKIINQIFLVGDHFSNLRVTEKMMVSDLDKFEAKILTIEKICDLTTLTVVELARKLQAHKQQSLIHNPRKVLKFF